MQIQTHFEQAHFFTAARLDGALRLLDEGKHDEARALIAEAHRLNDEQARVIDPRIHAAICRLCEARQIDSRRLFSLLLALGLREIGRNIMLGYCPDIIGHHQPYENDLFAHLIGHFPRTESGAICTDSMQRADYQNGNAALWQAFLDDPEGSAWASK